MLIGEKKITHKGGRPDLVEVRWARIGVPEAKQP